MQDVPKDMKQRPEPPAADVDEPENKARRVDAGIRELYAQWEDRTRPFSPYGDLADEEDDYDEEDDDDWKPLGAPA
jgi:hypothetical protein